MCELKTCPTSNHAVGARDLCVPRCRRQLLLTLDPRANLRTRFARVYCANIPLIVCGTRFKRRARQLLFVGGDSQSSVHEHISLEILALASCNTTARQQPAVRDQTHRVRAAATFERGKIIIIIHTTDTHAVGAGCQRVC